MKNYKELLEKFQNIQPQTEEERIGLCLIKGQLAYLASLQLQEEVSSQPKSPWLAAPVPEPEETRKVVEEKKEESELPPDSVEDPAPVETVKASPISCTDTPTGTHSMPSLFFWEDGNALQEMQRPLNDFYYQQSRITLKTPQDSAADEVQAIIYPFFATMDQYNVPILVFAQYRGTHYIASSYDNAGDGVNMVQMKIGPHELLFQGCFEKGKFFAKIMTSGESAQRGEVLREIGKQNSNPELLYGSGHIRFTYEAGAGIRGGIEVFPIVTQSWDGQNADLDFLVMRNVAEFTDYLLLSEEDFRVATSTGTMLLDVSCKQNIVQAQLVE